MYDNFRQLQTDFATAFILPHVKAILLASLAFRTGILLARLRHASVEILGLFDHVATLGTRLLIDRDGETFDARVPRATARRQTGDEMMTLRTDSIVVFVFGLLLLQGAFVRVAAAFVRLLLDDVFKTLVGKLFVRAVRLPSLFVVREAVRALFRLEEGASAVVGGVDDDAAGMIGRVETLWSDARLPDAALLSAPAEGCVDVGFDDVAFRAVGIAQFGAALAANRDSAPERRFLSCRVSKLKLPRAGRVSMQTVFSKSDG